MYLANLPNILRTFFFCLYSCEIATEANAMKNFLPFWVSLLWLLACAQPFERPTAGQYPYAFVDIHVLPLPQTVEETSGLAEVGGLLWTHNDSGGDPCVYGLDTETGEVKRTVCFEGAQNRDWEDMSADKNYLYVADTGNNAGKREGGTIYRVLLADLLAGGDSATIPADRIEFTYGHYQPTILAKKHNYDCEGLAARDGQLHLFSKNRLDGDTYRYQLPGEPGHYTISPLDTFASLGRVTGADFTPEGDTLVLLGVQVCEDVRAYYPCVWRFSGYAGDDFFAGKAERLELDPQTQMEGICYRAGGDWWVTTEEGRSFDVQLYCLPGQAWENDSIIPPL